MYFIRTLFNDNLSSTALIASVWKWLISDESKWRVKIWDTEGTEGIHQKSFSGHLVTNSIVNWISPLCSKIVAHMNARFVQLCLFFYFFYLITLSLRFYSENDYWTERNVEENDFSVILGVLPALLGYLENKSKTLFRGVGVLPDT
jgi:hypothetical protein